MISLNKGGGDLTDGDLLDVKVNVKALSPLKLAFIGDAIFESLVRRTIVYKYNEPMASLNKRKVALVCCKGQSEFIKKIVGDLTPEELRIYKRGRNAHIKKFPKNSSAMDYHCATGLECLCGYLYLSGNLERIEELLKKWVI